jgi:hypothetical protein
MNELTVGRPKREEYTLYHGPFVDRVEGSDVIASLREQLDELLGFLGHLDPATADYRYAEGKWSVKEVIGHVIDTERVFAYRALAFARGERTPLPGFEQDEYVRGGDFSHRSMQSLTNEFEHLRLSNVSLFSSFTEDTWDRFGTADGSALSVRAIAYVVVGHAAHHISVIRERYLGTA